MLSYELRTHLSRLGQIFSNLSYLMFVSGLLCYLATAISAIFIPLLYILWILAIIFSIGILLLVDNFRNLPTQIANITNNSIDFVNIIVGIAPYLFGIGVILSIFSIILLSFEPKQNKHTERIIFSIVLLVIIIIIFAGIILGGLTR